MPGRVERDLSRFMQEAECNASGKGGSPSRDGVADNAAHTSLKGAPGTQKNRFIFPVGRGPKGFFTENCVSLTLGMFSI